MTFARIYTASLRIRLANTKDDDSNLCETLEISWKSVSEICRLNPHNKELTTKNSRDDN